MLSPSFKTAKWIVKLFIRVLLIFHGNEGPVIGSHDRNSKTGNS